MFRQVLSLSVVAGALFVAQSAEARQSPKLIGGTPTYPSQPKLGFIGRPVGYGIAIQRVTPHS